jgi:iron complex outermembrane receptor protein
MHGVSIKTFTKETFDWEIAGSLYDYQKDQKRQNTTALPGAASGGAGTIATGDGTGWNNVTLRGTWRPFGYRGTHVVDFGAGQDAYQLKYLTSFITGNWISDSAGPKASHVGGKTDVQNLYAQDAWTISEHWKTVLGLRSEHWQAKDGFTQIATSATNATLLANSKWGERSENVMSPKAAVSYQWASDTVIKTAAGRAIRFPTVAELYGGTSTTNSQFINDPNLKPERSWTGELSVEKEFEKSLLRVTLFAENTHDGLYSQTITDPLANRNISRVQNVGRVETEGMETAFSARDLLISGMDINASATFTKSIIKENSGFVTMPGDTLGKWQPNIPRWRATALVNYHVDEHLSTSLAMRYSGRQFRTLNNADVNGYTYQGVSKYFTLDARVLYRFNKQWSGAVGIDNLNNYKYWNFHPYPQRSFVAELKFDL